VAVRLALAALDAPGGNPASLRYERLSTRLVIRSSTGPPVDARADLPMVAASQ